MSNGLQVRNYGIRMVANLTGDFSTSLDLDLAVDDFASDRTSCPDEQTSTYNEISVKAALYIGVLSGAFSVEDATLLDNYVRAVGQLCFDLAFHNQSIAGGDLTLNGNARSDDQRPNVRCGFM